MATPAAAAAAAAVPGAAAAVLSTAQSLVEELRPLAAALRAAVETANASAAAELGALGEGGAVGGAVGRAARLERDYGGSLKLLVRLRAAMDELLGLAPEAGADDSWSDSDDSDDEDNDSRLGRRVREMGMEIRMLRSRAAKAGVDSASTAVELGAEMRERTLTEERAAFDNAQLHPPSWSRSASLGKPLRTRACPFAWLSATVGRPAPSLLKSAAAAAQG